MKERLCGNCEYAGCALNQGHCKGCWLTNEKPNFVETREAYKARLLRENAIRQSNRARAVFEQMIGPGAYKIVEDKDESSIYPDRMISMRLPAIDYGKFVHENENKRIYKELVNSLYGKQEDKEMANIQRLIKDVIFNDPATIVLWKDGSKTVVKAKDEKFDPEKGLAMAISKRVMGDKGNYYETFKKWLPEKKEEEINENI